MTTRRAARTRRAAAFALLLAAVTVPGGVTACAPAAPGPPAGTVAVAAFDTGEGGPGLLRIGVAPPSGDVVVLVADRAGLPRDVEAVEVVLSPPSGAPAAVWLHRVETGHHHGSAALHTPGRWLLTVTVRTGPAGTDTAEIPFAVPHPGAG